LILPSALEGGAMMGFSFWSPRSRSQEDELLDQAPVLSPGGALSPGQALVRMLDVLRKKYLRDLPALDVSVVGVVVLDWGRGGRYRGSHTPLATDKGCLEVRVRFQFWADELDEVDAAIEALHKRLFAARDELRADGFLHVAIQETLLAEHTRLPRPWRKSTDYKILYEFSHHHASSVEPHHLGLHW
jgi:hypothetical protein